MREYLFKAKRVDNGEWVEGSLVNNMWAYSGACGREKGSPVCEIITGEYGGDDWLSAVEYSEDELIVKVIPETVCQYTGLTDKNGDKIFEGDEVLIREPHRLSQTHYGDNIPLGQYTEQMEPVIYEYKSFVKFDEGCFHIVGKAEDNFSGFDINRPISWEVIQYTDFNKSEMIDRFYSDKSCWIEDGDLGYLLEEYGLKDENELMSFLGLELTGSIHDKTIKQ